MSGTKCENLKLTVLDISNLMVEILKHHFFPIAADIDTAISYLNNPMLTKIHLPLVSVMVVVVVAAV